MCGHDHTKQHIIKNNKHPLHILVSGSGGKSYDYVTNLNNMEDCSLNFNANADGANPFSTLVNNSGILTLPFASNTFIEMPLTGSNDGKNTQKTFHTNKIL